MTKEQAEQFFFSIGWGTTPPTGAFVYQYAKAIPDGDSGISCATNDIHTISNNDFSMILACTQDSTSNAVVVFTKEQVTSNDFTFLYQLESV